MRDSRDSSPEPDCRDSWPGSAQVQGEGLLHDARNLMGTLGLYCDLLSMPGVLKPEHREYADDLRFVGTRSGALIERLVAHLVQSGADGLRQGARSRAEDGAAPSHLASPTQPGRSVDSRCAVRPVSLRRIVERCSGLLSRVASGREVEVRYGEAADVPVPVAEDAVERILVNLVRNAAAALAQRTLSCDSAEKTESFRDDEAETTGTIRIGVGLLVNRVGDAKPWPFRRVRLTVEDSGRGMTQEQLEGLLSDSKLPSRGTHGIGFRVVRELVTASNGDLRVMSAPGIGTCVQIEWPIAAAPLPETTETRVNSAKALLRAGSGPAAAGWVSC
jgi:signal transduction histidine kinase